MEHPPHTPLVIPSGWKEKGLLACLPRLPWGCSRLCAARAGRRLELSAAGEPHARLVRMGLGPSGLGGSLGRLDARVGVPPL